VAALDARPGANYILSGTVESLSGIARRLDRLTGHRRLRAFPPARMALRLATDNDRLGAPLRGLPTPGTLQIMAHFPSVVDGSRAERELGIRYRPLDETLEDAIRWWVAAGMLDKRTAGRLAAAAA
jgi:dihydroflavonol-4-reductase